MFKKLITLVALVFLLGWLSNTFYSQYALAHASPSMEGEIQATPLLDLSLAAEQPAAERSPATYGQEVSSPADRLNMGNVHVTGNEVVIDGIPGRQFETAVFTSTHSMDPVLDETSQAIQIIPMSSDEIRVGDVISYDSGKYGVIIHRVIGINTDASGWYAVVKGDNNPSPDPIKVRFSMIKRVLVGVLY
jgi:hypothetical protein